MKGGETVLQKGDGSELAFSYPQAGYLIVVQVDFTCDADHQSSHSSIKPSINQSIDQSINPLIHSHNQMILFWIRSQLGIYRRNQLPLDVSMTSTWKYCPALISFEPSTSCFPTAVCSPSPHLLPTHPSLPFEVSCILLGFQSDHANLV